MFIKLARLAHCRSGDKGNTSNISVIAYCPELYETIKIQLSAAKFKDFYAGVVNGSVTRYSIDGLHMLNFVCEGALGGGVSRSLCLDNYGKSLSSRILSFEMHVEEHLEQFLR
ncbi:MAG: hypothetical protein O3B03_04645 [Proteobacteria bacterium]|nr:hypothetical protein [Pseudomonadota bacterium]MDA1331133.1 hypothetical protein [Pseudomonadota bacterium]